MKVLIISHNPMSTKHSIGKTLLSLFSTFKKEELCQLYIHTGLPEREVCTSFFKVTDKDVLRGVVTRSVKGRTVKAVSLNKQVLCSEQNFYKKVYSNVKNREPHREVLRDVMWKISPWYNKELKAWIEQQEPTCIFVAIGSGKFLYDMALKISKDYQLPIFTYVCDDFYSMKAPRAPLGKMWKNLLVKKTRELMKRTKTVVSICEELSGFYSKEFSIPAKTVMTGTNYELAEKFVVKDTVKNIRYFGKLTINRYKSMADICRAIDAINIEKGTNYQVEIYCGETTTEIEKEFKNIRSAKFCGFITGSAFKEAFFSTDILIHVEAFDESSIDRVKYSVSTKIADSLASGIPLLAYGPEQVASIKHLIRNKAGIVVTQQNKLKNMISEMLESKDVRMRAAVHGLETANEYHNPQNVSESLFQLLLSETCR